MNGESARNTGAGRWGLTRRCGSGLLTADQWRAHRLRQVADTGGPVPRRTAGWAPVTACHGGSFMATSGTDLLAVRELET